MPTTATLSALLVAAAVILAPGHDGQLQTADSHPVPVSEKHKNITFADDCLSIGPTCTTVFGRKYTHDVLAPAASGTGTGLTAAATGVCYAAVNLTLPMWGLLVAGGVAIVVAVAGSLYAEVRRNRAVGTSAE